MKKILVLVAAVAVSTLVYANTVGLKADRPDGYTVVPGDTLWDISARFLRDPWQWPEIWHINQQVENPHLIYPGDRLRLVWKDGKPVLQLNRTRATRNTIKLSPRARPVHLSDAIPTVPLEAIRPFLQHPRVVSKREMERAPYVLGTRDGRLLSGAEENVYARGVKGKGSRYRIYRKGQVYRNPKNNRVLGYEAIFIGNAVVRVGGDPAKIYLSDTNREVMAGDRLLDAGKQDLQLHFTPHAPDQQLTGSIIAVLDGVSRIGQYQVVVLDLGTNRHIERGHVLSIHQSGRKIRDQWGKKTRSITLPDEKAGVLMVFQPFEKVSYALVMSALTEIKVFDKVKNPR